MATLSKENKKKILDATIAEIKKNLPDDTVGIYSEIGKDIQIETITTGSLAVDAAIGGGLAKGKIIEIVGKTSSGKTTLALTAIAALQKENPDANILFVDAEHALDPSYAKQLGVNIETLVIVQPSNGENGFLAAEMFVNSGVADMIVIDSIAALTPKAILETEYGADGRIGAMARLISQGVRKLYKSANQHKTTVILINQLKPAVKTSMYQVTGNSTMGSWYTPGGEELPFYTTQILEIARTGQVKEGEKVVSNIISMTCRKNKIAPPFTKAEFFITFGQGVDKYQEVRGVGEALGIIEKIGRSIYTIPAISEDIRVNGRENFINFLKENPDVMEQASKLIKEKLKGVRDIKLDKESNDEDKQYENSDSSEEPENENTGSETEASEE